MLCPSLLHQGDDDEVWWETSFDIPKTAVAVNFVVNCENAWDNNGGKDHKVRQLGVCVYVYVGLVRQALGCAYRGDTPLSSERGLLSEKCVLSTTKAALRVALPTCAIGSVTWTVIQSHFPLHFPHLRHSVLYQ